MHSHAAERLTGQQWLLLLILAGVQFTNVLDFVVMMPLAIQFHEAWDLTPKEFGALVASYSFAAAVSGLLATWFIDRLDRKRSLVLIYGGFILATAFCAAAPGYWGMLLSRATAGMFGGVLGGTILAIVGDVIPMSRRGFATGIIMSSFSVASIVGIPLSLYIAEQYSWRWPFASLAVLSGVLLILAQALLPTFRGHLHHHQGPRGNPWRNLWELLKEPNLVRAYVLMGAMIVTTFMIVPYLPGFLVANVGMDQKDLKWVYLAGGIATLLVMAPVGKLADRFGKLRVYQVLAALTVIPVLAVTNLPPAPLWVLLTVTTVLMVITSSRSVPAMALVTACTTPRKRGGFMSVMGSTNQLAMGLATTLAGFVLGVTALPEQPTLTTATGQLSGPVQPIEGFPIVGWISCAMTLATIYLATRLRAPDGSPIEGPRRSTTTEVVKEPAAPCPDADLDVKQCT